MKKLLTTLLVLLQVAAAPLLVVATVGATVGNVAVLYFAPPGNETATTGTVSLDASGNIAVNVKVNTHGADSAGADVIVTFHTSEMQYVSGSMPASDVFYPVVVKGAPTSAAGVTAANTAQKISMARTISSPETPGVYNYTNGDGVFATLVFKPVSTNPVGTTVQLGFEYSAGNTTDSNVTGTVNGSSPDILSGVKPVTLTIQNTSGDSLTGVAVTPATASIATGATQTLTATPTPTTAAGVTYAWTLSGTGGGSLSSNTGSSVTYTAGSSANTSATAVVVATQGNITENGSSVISIGVGTGLSSVTLTPATASLVSGATQTFTAAANITDGVTYTWTLTGGGSLSSTTGSSVTYTAGSSAATITVVAAKGSATATDSSTVTITDGSTPVIDHIVPGQGDENADVEIEIYGSNFGSEDGRVYIGSRLADIISWSATKIVVLVPQVSVSRDTEYQVKVRRSDGAEARYMGYTYLDKTGLPLLPWLIMFPMNGAAAMFAKKRWFKKK